MKRAIYPGSFDPVHYGHIDVIKRASKMFDELIVSVIHNKNKSALFSTEERVTILNRALADIPNVTVDSFDGLLVNYCKQKKVSVIVRGLRAITDFEFELQNAQTNAKLSNGGVDTIFLTTNLEYAYLSSSAVKEIAYFGGDVSMCVPDYVADMVREKFGTNKG